MRARYMLTRCWGLRIPSRYAAWMSAIVASRSSNCSELSARPIPVKAIAVAKIAVAKTSRYVRKWRVMVHDPLVDEARIDRHLAVHHRLYAGDFGCRPRV